MVGDGGVIFLSRFSMLSCAELSRYLELCCGRSFSNEAGPTGPFCHLVRGNRCSLGLLTLGGRGNGRDTRHQTQTWRTTSRGCGREHARSESLVCARGAAVGGIASAISA